MSIEVFWDKENNTWTIKVCNETSCITRVVGLKFSKVFSDANQEYKMLCLNWKRKEAWELCDEMIKHLEGSWELNRDDYLMEMWKNRKEDVKQ